MNIVPWDQTFVGWIHITSAAAAVGFFFVWRAAILSAGAEAGRAVVGRYAPFFWAAAVLLPVTGSYTWYIRTGQGYPGYYFHVLYTKIFLYLVLFGLAGALTKAARGPGGAESRRGMLTVCVALCFVLMFLSAFMRRVTPVRAASAPAAVAAAGTARAEADVYKKGVAPGWQN